MVHSGYEATAVMDTVKHPIKALAATIRGPRTEGDFAPDVDLSKQRKAEWVYESVVADGHARLEAEGRTKPTRRAS
jgi:hypothetical protein